MSLKDITLHAEPTVTIVAGGSQHHLVEDTQNVVNGYHLIDVSEPDFMDRIQVTVKSKNPTLDAKTGLISAVKRSVVLAKPVLDSKGNVRFDSLRLELNALPGDVSRIALLRVMATQILDEIAFWESGT